MPEFYVDDIEIEPHEFVKACRKSEIRDLIVELVDEGHLPKTVLSTTASPTKSTSKLQIEFAHKLEMLSEKYHTLSNEDEEIIEKIFKKYL